MAPKTLGIPDDIMDEIRKVRIAFLARPKPVMEDPYVYKDVRTRPTTAALHYVASDRIIHLSTPLADKYNPKYIPLPPTEHYVNRASLYYTPSNRIIELAKPSAEVKKERRSSTVSLIKQEYRESMKNAFYRKFRKTWLKLRAAPKGPPKPHEHPPLNLIITRGDKTYVRSDLGNLYAQKTFFQPKKAGVIDEDRLQELCKPTRRVPKYKVIIEPDNYVQKREKDLKTKLSQRMKELYQHRELAPEALLDLHFQPFVVSKYALRYVATPRIIKLALPMVRSERKNDDDEGREDAFTVPRRALRAICSERIAELAKPIMRE